MLGRWNIAQATDEEPNKAQTLPNMRAELSAEDMMTSSVPAMGSNGQENSAQRIQHVTRIIHRNRGSKKSNLAAALLSHSKLAEIVSGAAKNKGSKIASPPIKRNTLALQKFKAKARKIIEVERDKKQDDAKVDQHPRLDYLNHQAYEYLRKCEYTKQLILKIQEKIKRSKKAVAVLWKLRREYQHKKDHERRWTSRDVEHREFDMVTAQQELSINAKEETKLRNNVDAARKVNLTKTRARDQIQAYIDRLVVQQERHVRKVHEMEALTDMMEMEHQADIRGDRHTILHWEMEYNSLRLECEQLERKSLDQRMKETKHLTAAKTGSVQVRAHITSNRRLALFPGFFCYCYLFLMIFAVLCMMYDDNDINKLNHISYQINFSEPHAFPLLCSYVLMFLSSLAVCISSFFLFFFFLFFSFFLLLGAGYKNGNEQYSFTFDWEWERTKKGQNQYCYGNASEVKELKIKLGNCKTKNLWQHSCHHSEGSRGRYVETSCRNWPS